MPERICGIYKITSPKGKVYIGQSWNIHARWYQHSREARFKTYLAASIKKHGFENHNREIIHVLPDTISQVLLNKYEQFYLDLYRAFKYVMLNTKEAGAGGKYADSVKIKIGLANKGRKPWNTGRNDIISSITPEGRKKISARHKGVKRDPVVGAKISAANLGKKMTQVAKDKMSKAKIGKPSGRLGKKNTPEHIAKTSAGLKGKPSWNKGVPCRPETKFKLREAHKDFIFTEEHRAKLKANSFRKGTRVIHSEETKLKISKSKKGVKLGPRQPRLPEPIADNQRDPLCDLLFLSEPVLPK